MDVQNPQLLSQRGLFSLALVGLLLATSQANAVVVFDNGSLSGTQVGRNLSGPFVIYEDFTLSAATTVTGLNWTGHDPPQSGYTNTTLAVFSGLGLPSAATRLFTMTVVANRVVNGAPVLFGNLQGFNYGISGLSLTLGTGVYYFSLSNNATSITTWDSTTGTAQTIAGRWQNSGGPPVVATDFFATENSAFQVIGSPVPEPMSAALFGLGLAALSAIRRRKTY